MSGSTSILDSLAPAVPTPGMLATQATAKGSSATSVLDSLTPVSPSPAMTALQPKPALTPQDQTPHLPAWAGGPGHARDAESPATQQPEPSLSNIAGAVPSGLYQGVASLPNLPTNVINTGLNVARGFGADMPKGNLQPPINSNPTNYQPIGPVAETVHNASSALGATAATGVAGGLAASLLPEASTAGNVIRAATTPTPSVLAASTLAGGAEVPAENSVSEEWKPVARILADIGAGGGIAGAEGATRAITGSAEPEVAALARQAKSMGIDIRPGQMTDSRVIRQLDSALQSIPLSGLRGASEEQQTQLNRAVANTFGEDADKITPDVLNNARSRIGGVMQDVENRNNVQFSDPVINRLAQIEADARTNLTDDEYGVVARNLNNMLSPVQAGDQVSGQTFGNLIHKGAPLDKLMNNANPNVAGYGSQIRETLRDALQESLSPDDAAAYSQARTQWKNMKTIEPLTLRADVVGGPSASTGDIIPAQLRGVVNRSYGNAANADLGQIPLNDLAKVGQRFMKELPSSGTSERSNIFRWLERGGALAGAAVGGEHYLGMPVGEMVVPGLLTTGATAGIARGLGAAVKSDRLANRLMGVDTGVPSLTQRSVPLLTSSGIRQLEPPEAPSTNPRTGLPEFSLAANQAKASVGDKLLDGSLADHAATQDWITKNKRDLRGQYGGQGLQNISLVASLMRKASDPKQPQTVMSALMNGEPPKKVIEAFQSVGVQSPSDLLSLVVSSPALAKELSAKLGPKGIGRVPRLVSAIKAAGGVGTDSGSDPALRDHVASSGRVRPLGGPSDGPAQPPVSTSPKSPAAPSTGIAPPLKQQLAGNALRA